ncbi:acetylglutamate kinase [Roseisolibacter agri]|uniref:Acetylglutamate kinase n=1 Tax=Roseisolibacter agri TaxID=2014610 RepID=A0AA37Q693_9BACT|nr:acetylglutamate kinase [Roseisolibacter agri]GLC24497.1 acetylglutamate kinase [Roseisolibacter agri]
MVPPHGTVADAHAALHEVFRGAVVVKLGGRTQGDPALPAALAAVSAATGGRLVVVHGGGDAVSEIQRARGITPEFIGGRRVTTDADVDVIRMALSGLANKQLVSALLAAGVAALGLSGEDGVLLEAAPTADVRMGRVGEPARVNVALLALLVGAGYCPVISPVSASTAARGVALNVNGDDAAAAVAAAVGAAELFFMADVPGVLVDGAPVASLDPAGAAALVRAGTAGGGMAAKLDAAQAALARGVGRVRIGDLAALADPARGTAIVTGAAAPATA